MNKQKPMQYDENRFTIPKSHPHYQELTSVTREFPFTLIKTGFDHYDIPFYFDGNGFIIGEGADQKVIAPDDYSKWYDDNAESHFDEKNFMSDNLLPYFNEMIEQESEKRMNCTADEAFRAHQHLSVIERVSLTYKDTENIRTYQTLWEVFHDLKILTSYISQVATITYEKKDWLYYQTIIQRKWEADTKHTFFLNDFDEMMDLFSVLKPLYFRHEYSKSPKEPTLRYILEDYRELAKLYTCHLDISLDDNSATLLTVRGNSVSYANYQLFTEHGSEYDIADLLSAIQNCWKRKSMDNKDCKKLQTTILDNYNALTNFLRTM